MTLNIMTGLTFCSIDYMERDRRKGLILLYRLAKCNAVIWRGSIILYPKGVFRFCRLAFLKVKIMHSEILLSEENGRSIYSWRPVVWNEDICRWSSCKKTSQIYTYTKFIRLPRNLFIHSFINFLNSVPVIIVVYFKLLSHAAFKTDLSTRFTP